LVTAAGDRRWLLQVVAGPTAHLTRRCGARRRRTTAAEFPAVDGVCRGLYKLRVTVGCR